MFCRQCGVQIPDGSAFCSVCGASQGSAAPGPALMEAGGPPLLDELFENVGVVAEQELSAPFTGGQRIRLRAIVESGGPFELLIMDSNGEVLRTWSGIIATAEFEHRIPEDGEYGFGFQSTELPGTVRLRVYETP